MLTRDKKSLLLAAQLSALAGFTDAIGFLRLGGYFVSFMSGNSTRLAVNAAGAHTGETASLPAALITLFVMGVIIGFLARHFFDKNPVGAVLGFVTVVLFAGAGFSAVNYDLAAIVCLVLAMGAVNNVFIKDGQVEIGVTYMTGTLVKFGQKIAAAILGGPISACLPYVVLWVGLAGGAIAGTFSYNAFGFASLWAAALFALWILILNKFLRKRTKPHGPKPHMN
jgi:uncharacterized membrane protein YoaK (UPF0700 family)